METRSTDAGPAGSSRTAPARSPESQRRIVELVVFRMGAEEFAAEIVQEHFLKGRPLQKHLWQAPEARKIVEQKKQVPFFEKQLKVVLSNCGRIDPENVGEYIAQRGYEALGQALTDIASPLFRAY